MIEHCSLNLRIEDDTEQSNRKGFDICLNEGKNNQYIKGFKQAIAHIVGILTGEPTEHNPENYSTLLDKKPKFAFASVIFDLKNIDSKACSRYSDFYKSTIGRLSDINCFKSIFCNMGFKYNEIKIYESVITYQSLIKKNPQYTLPSAFKGYYRI